MCVVAVVSVWRGIRIGIFIRSYKCTLTVIQAHFKAECGWVCCLYLFWWFKIRNKPIGKFIFIPGYASFGNPSNSQDGNISWMCPVLAPRRALQSSPVLWWHLFLSLYVFFCLFVFNYLPWLHLKWALENNALLGSQTYSQPTFFLEKHWDWRIIFCFEKTFSTQTYGIHSYKLFKWLASYVLNSS